MRQDVLLHGDTPAILPIGGHDVHRGLTRALRRIAHRHGDARKLEHLQKKNSVSDIWEKWGRHIWGKGCVGDFTQKEH